MTTAITTTFVSDTHNNVCSIVCSNDTIINQLIALQLSTCERKLSGCTFARCQLDTGTAWVNFRLHTKLTVLTGSWCGIRQFGSGGSSMQGCDHSVLIAELLYPTYMVWVGSTQVTCLGRKAYYAQAVHLQYKVENLVHGLLQFSTICFMH